MRELGKGIESTKIRVERLKGIPLLLKVDEGRGKSSLYHGTIINVFPAVFTVQIDEGKTKTFSYADVHTRGILFMKNNELPT